MCSSCNRQPSTRLKKTLGTHLCFIKGGWSAPIACSNQAGVEGHVWLSKAGHERRCPPLRLPAFHSTLYQPFCMQHPSLKWRRRSGFPPVKASSHALPASIAPRFPCPAG